MNGSCSPTCLPRHAALRGRVVDAAGRPLAGRLVARGTEPRSSLTMARVFGEPGAEAASNTATTATTATTLPGEPGFELDRGEALTVGDGSFTLTALEAWLDQLLTVTPDNEMRSHSIAMLQPGEAREGIELVVPETTQLHLLLTDKSGTALVLDEPWRCQIAFQLLLRDGRLIYPQSFTPFSRPAEFAVCFAVPPIEAAGLCITLDGYEPFTQRLTTPPARRERIDCTLPPSVEHSLRLRFVLPANAPRLPRHWSLAVHACLAPPGRPTPRNSDGAEITLDCCGFGGSATVDLGETSDLELIVQSARPFFLRARSSFAGWQSAELPLGRFAPGVRSPVSSPDPSHNDWQIIELPPALLPPASGEEAAAAKALAQKAFREQLTHTTGLRVSLLDATTRAPIGGYFEVELPLTDPNRRTDAQWHHVANTESGESPTTLTVPQVARGLRVHAFGYRDAAPIDLPPLDGAPLHQLAPITLEPLPVLRVEIRDASGAPLRTEFPVAASPNVLASWASAGTSLLRGDLPEVFEVSIGDGSRQRWTASGESQPQWELRLGRADLIAFPELTLPPLFERTVALDLAAVDAELRSGNKTLFATPVGMPFGATRARVGASRVSDDPELRRFHYLLPVGRWRFEAAAMLFEIEPLEVEVAARLAGDRSADSAAPIVLRAR
ncbi:MAG: hypothetical protein EXS13_13140 [Planctomycetes bacterium]|nr:hypothetical protein [Planctomycetota bacterium]